MEGHLLSSDPRGSSAEQVVCVCYRPTERPQAKAVLPGLYSHCWAGLPSSWPSLQDAASPHRGSGAPTQAGVRVNLYGVISTVTDSSDMERDRLGAHGLMAEWRIERITGRSLRRDDAAAGKSASCSINLT